MGAQYQKLGAKNQARYNALMPIYEYQPETDASCDYCENGFEVLKKINAPHPESCPECGAPILRKISAPNLTKASPSLDRANIEKHGFTQYRKAGDGVYEKTAGKGPNVINKDKVLGDG